MFAGVAAVLACAAHGVGDGEPPHLGSMLVLTALFAFGARGLTRRQRGPLTIVGFLGVSQLVAHLMLSWLSTHHHGFTPTGTMVAAHAAAAIVTGLVLAWAEAAVFAVARVLAACLPVALRPRLADQPLWVATPSSASSAARSAVLAQVRLRRGPPRFS